MDKLISPSPVNKRIYDWMFVAVLIFVVAFKFNDIFLPYFWDELGVYARAVNYQYKHALSLMPSSVPVIHSRGHPLLFTFIYALVFKIFGNEVYVAHILSLFVSLLVLGLVYIKTARYFNQLAAIVSVILIAVQPVFMAQSSLVLPEIMLSLFILLSLTSYYEKKYFQFALFASMAILTKESAIVLPVTVLVYSLVQLIIFKNKTDAMRVRNIILALLPYGVFGVFLLIQKQQNGWYFFPYHMEALSFNLDRFEEQFSRFFNFIFWAQERYWCEKIIFIAIAISIFTHKLNWRSAEKSFFTLTGIFILMFFSFSALNFYMDRYVMAVFFLAFMIVGVALTSISSNKFFIAIVTSFLCVIGFENMENGTFNYDIDLGYRHQVRSLQQAIDYVAGVSKPGETMSGNFPAYVAIDFKHGGYLEDKKMNAIMASNMDVDYFIFSDPGTEMRSGNYEITLLKSFKDGFAQTKVYKLREKQK